MKILEPINDSQKKIYQNSKNQLNQGKIWSWGLCTIDSGKFH